MELLRRRLASSTVPLHLFHGTVRSAAAPRGTARSTTCHTISKAWPWARYFANWTTENASSGPCPTAPSNLQRNVFYGFGLRRHTVLLAARRSLCIFSRTYLLSPPLSAVLRKEPDAGACEYAEPAMRKVSRHPRPSHCASF